MKRVDFIGASGSGKSTVYRELHHQGAKKGLWFTPREAQTLVAKNHLKTNKKSSRDLLFKAILSMPYSEHIQPKVAEYVLSKRVTESLWQKAEEHKTFLSAVLKGASNEDREPLHRLMGLNWFYSVCKNVVFLENSFFQEIVLYDESLSQKVFGVTDWHKGKFKHTAEEYFYNLPLPAGLIYFYIAPEAAFKRLKERDKVTTGQHKLDEQGLLESIEAQAEIAATGTEILKNRGVKLLELDSELPPAQNAERIISFIKAELS